eukprot:478494-Rhodomonas_salina.2
MKACVPCASWSPRSRIARPSSDDENRAVFFSCPQPAAARCSQLSSAAGPEVKKEEGGLFRAQTAKTRVRFLSLVLFPPSSARSKDEPCVLSLFLLVPGR